MFNIITGINESKILTKHITCECKCKFDGRKCNSDQWCNNNKCRCECKKRHVSEKNYVLNPAACSCENGKYLASVLDDSAIMCDEIIYADVDAEAKSNDKAKLNNKAKSNEEETKTIPRNFNEKKVTCKTQKFYILLAFLLITIALLIAVSICCYLIKH